MSQAKERPILFSGPMVRAILEGRKTATRRVVKPQPDFLGSMTDPTTPFKTLGAGLHGQIVCPYGQAGDRLWVRETFAIYGDRKMAAIHYRADHPHHVGQKGMGYKPSIHMPRWASRILLEVTDVRVERLQDISDDQAKAEGMVYTDFGMQERPGKVSLDGGNTFHPVKPQQAPGWHAGDATHPDQCLDRARWAFANLWERINGEYSWDANPWVWVVEFKRI